MTVVGLGCVVGLGVVASRLLEPRSAYAEALATLPAETQRAAFTDWEFARSELGSAGDLQAFLDSAYDRDLTRTSALESSAAATQEVLGLDLRHAEWEMYGQSDEGSVAVIRLLGTASLDPVRSALARSGWAAPASEDHAWTADATALAGLSTDFTPVHQNILLLEDEQLAILSDDPDYAERTAEVARGERDSLLDQTEELSDQAAQAVSAVLWRGDFACTAHSMAHAGEDDRVAADRLVQEAGGVDPLAGLVMGRLPSGDVQVALEFAGDDQARANLQPRTELAAGEAVGIGGRFEEKFTVRSSVRDGRFVALRLRPVEGAVLSVLSTGPTLFATC